MEGALIVPRYDWRCEAGHRFEASTSIDRRDKPGVCLVCGRTSTRLFTPTTNLHGMTTPGTEAWDGGGRFGGKAGSSDGAMVDMRRRLEAGAVTGGDRSRALAYVREAQMAHELGLHAEAEMYQRGLAELGAKADREKRGEPELVRVGKRRARKIVTTTRRKGGSAQRVVSYMAA